MEIVEGFTVPKRGMARRLAKAVGNPGRVWCRSCGRSMAIDAAECFHAGWPKCCGATMTVDDPEADDATP